MATPLPLAVFDLDGTLVDSAPDLVATLNHILVGRGFRTFDVAELIPLIGAGSRALISRAYASAGKTLEPERLQELHSTFLSYYDSHLADRSRLYPGVERALDQFAEAGWSFAVCTNKMQHAARKLLEQLGVADRFLAICGQDTFQVDGAAISKPDPQAYLLTVRRAGGNLERSFMVGDSRTDIETAKAAERPVIAVDFGYSDRPVADYEPDVVISSFDALWPAAQRLGLVARAP